MRFEGSLHRLYKYNDHYLASTYVVFLFLKGVLEIWYAIILRGEGRTSCALMCWCSTWEHGRRVCTVVGLVKHQVRLPHVYGWEELVEVKSNLLCFLCSCKCKVSKRARIRSPCDI